jgi:drug/metabolite transporter (DMT)-like permease
MNNFTLLAILVAIFSASQVILMKHVTENHSSDASFALFSLFYFFLTLMFVGRNRDAVTTDVRAMAAPIILMILLAVILSFTSNYLYYKLLETNDMTITTALVSIAPIFVAIYSFMILRNSMSLKNIAGIGAVVAGVILLS